MFAPYFAFKRPEVLDEKKHKDLKIRVPQNFSFMKGVETIPIGFSEILPLTMYYPVMVGKFKDNFFPFAVMGLQGINIYINEENNFKVPSIPKACEVYPFFIIKENLYLDNNWIAIVDLISIDENGERLFDELGEPTEFFKQIKEKLKNLAFDFQKSIDFCKDLVSMNILKSINLEIKCKYGKAKLKNVYIADIESLKNIQPEKLYYLNSNGYLPVLYAMYFSARNFKLFDIL